MKSKRARHHRRYPRRQHDYIVKVRQPTETEIGTCYVARVYRVRANTGPEAVRNLGIKFRQRGVHDVRLEQVEQVRKRRAKAQIEEIGA